MPRKRRSHLCWALAAPPFNEAGAVMPRKSSRRAIDGFDAWGPSMRPGLLCPGKVFGNCEPFFHGPQPSMRPGLLCPGKGPGAWNAWQRCLAFNEAGAVMPRKSASPMLASIMSHRPSMRPGLLCPGKG